MNSLVWFLKPAPKWGTNFDFTQFAKICNAKLPWSIVSGVVEMMICQDFAGRDGNGIFSWAKTWSGSWQPHKNLTFGQPFFLWCFWYFNVFEYVWMVFHVFVNILDALDQCEEQWFKPGNRKCAFGSPWKQCSRTSADEKSPGPEAMYRDVTCVRCVRCVS